jgi:hypothetical protein
MAKRKETHEEELPFVALMDTMTNVVGVLIIVLVMMAISLANAVKKVMSSIPPATPQQIEETHQSIESLKKKIEEEKELLKDAPPPKDQLAKLQKLQQEAIESQKELDKKGVQIVNLDPMSKEVSKLQEELAADKLELTKEEAEILELKKKIAEIPDVKPPADKIVRLPDSKPIPKNSQIQQFFVTGAGILYANTEEVRDAFLKELDSSRARDKIQRNQVRKVPNKPSTTVYSHTNMIDYFGTNSLQSDNFTYKVSLEKTRTRPALVATPKEMAIEPIDRAITFSSNYQRALRNIRNKPDSIIIFKVANDGFDNYLSARDLCDKSGILAGWDFYDSPTLSREVPEVEMDQLEIPPPPAPPKPTPTPNPNEPKPIQAPTLKLD